MDGNMKTTKWLSLTLAAALNVGGWMAPPSLASDGVVPGSPRGRISQRIAEKLNLTADQKAQIKAVLSSEKDSLMPLLGHLHDARKGLRTAIHASEANEADVRGQLKNLRQEYNPQVVLIVSNANVEISALLTPAQQQRFEKVKLENRAFLQPAERSQ
jgi:Spy/CpxP family protein refolding chaperone